MKRILTALIFWVACVAGAQAQQFTFYCVGEYISGADCPECIGTTTSRLFNGLAIRRSGAYYKNIDCPFIVKVQGSNLVIQELIYPNPETVTINLLSTGYADINEFRDSVACPCAMQDTTSGGGGGGDPSITNEGILGVDAGGANTAVITSNTSGANGVTVSGSTTILVTESTSANGGTITLQADTSLIATINDIRNNTFDTVANYADLRLYDKGQKLIYVSGSGIEGFFQRIASGTDDDGTIIDGVFTWERVYDRSRLNVQWFGAVGDSITDDYAAIQATINEAIARQNTTVYFPRGKYRYTATLTMYKPIGVSICGAGMDNTYLFPVNVTGIYIRTDSTELVVDPKYGVAEGRDMAFKDFTMIRSGANTYTVRAIGIHVLGTFNRKMENLRVEEFFATGGAASGQGVGIKIDNPYDPILAPGDADDATQHNMFENIYINQCDTGMVLRLTNTVNMHNVKIDESRKVGIVLKNGVVWKGGMVQGSVNCGIYITEDPFPVKDIYLDGLHFESNSRTNPKYGTIYKGSATTMTNLEIVNCRFSQVDSSKIFNLRSVRYANITNNTYVVNLYDTLYFNGCNSIILGNDNYYEATTTSASSNITFLSGNLTVSTEALNGLTLQKDAPGPYALNVGGTAIVDDNLGVGTTGLPARKFHVQGEARITDLATDTPIQIVGADADGDLGAITVGTGLLLSGGTISTTVPSSVFSTSVALPTVVGNTREIGVLTHNEGGRAALVSIDVIADVSGLGNVKRYFFPLAFNSTGGAWVKLLPAVSNAVESSTQDFELEMRTNTSGTPTGGIDTIRIVRTGGSAAGNVDVIIQYYGVDIDANTFTSTSNTSTSAVTTTYSEQSIAQAANRVGVNTWQPAQSMHVEGTARITGSDGTATALVGRDADGDISAVALAAGLSIITGTLTPADNSATNEAWTIDGDDADTELITTQTVKFQGGGINATDYDAATNVLLITGTEVDGSTTNEIQTITASGSGTTYALDLSLSGGSVGIVEGTGITIDRTGNDLTFNATGGTNYQTWRDDGTPATQRPNANFVSTSDIAFTLTDDAGNTETEVTADIPANAVQYAEIQQVAASRLLGNPTGAPADVSEISLASGLSFAGTVLTPADASATNEAWTIDADDADTELITTQTVKFQGGGIVATDYVPGTDILTITGTEIDGSVTNEAWTIDGDAGDTEVISNQTVLISGAGINTTSYNAAGNTLTITGTEVDGSITNEGILGVGAGGANTAVVTSNTSGATGVTISGGGINAVTESTSANGGTITITATEVDGSTTNELQTFANTSDATSHTVTLSSSGGSVQLIEGSNITLTTGGTAGAGTVTIAATASGTNYQTVRDDGVDETQRAALNFVSTSTVNAVGTDDAGNNETEIALNVPTDGITATEIAAGAVGTSEIATNAVANDDFRQSAALSVVGNPTNATANVQDIAAASDFQVLRRSGTSVGFGQVNLASTNAVTGTLPVGNGGTGATSLTNNRLLTGNGTSAIVDEPNLTFDGSSLGVTSKISQSIGGSYSTSQNFNYISGTVTNTANNLVQYVSRIAPTWANDGTVTGNTYTGIRLEGTVASPTAASGYYGINFFMTNSSPNVSIFRALTARIDETSTSGNLANRYGMYFEVNKNSDAFDSHTGTGILAEVKENSSTGRWNIANALVANATNGITSQGIQSTLTNNRGTGNTQRGITINNNVSGAGVVVDNAYGIDLRGDASSSGVITNYYGLYQNTIPSGATSYFLYGNQSAARSYLSGTLAVGTNSNASKLFVRGTGATSATMAATFENSGGSDILNLRDDQRVGIITATPNRTLEVGGEVRITDLVTDTPTKIVGADADGDLDTVGIGAEAELHITGGTLGTNFHTTISPATLTTVTNNWNPTGLATAWIIELSGNGTFVLLTGITAPSFNKSLTLYNNGDNSILLPREFSTSTAGNRFAFEIVLFPGKQIEIRYSVSEARWLLKSKAGAYEDVQEFYANHLFQSPVSITTGDFDFWEIDSEAAASVVAPTSNAWSGVSVNTSTSAGGLGYVSSKEPFFQTDNSSGSATWAYCKAVIRTPASLSDGTNDYSIRVGFNTTNGGGGATDGMYFSYNHSLVSGNWGTATTNGGSTQMNNSGVAVTTNTTYVLEMYVQPSLLVSFFINGVHVATNDTFVSTGDDMYALAEIEKSVGTTQRDLIIYTLQTSAAFVNNP